MQRCSIEVDQTAGAPEKLPENRRYPFYVDRDKGELGSNVLTPGVTHRLAVGFQLDMPSSCSSSASSR